MYNFIAVGFKGTHRASEVLGQVQELNDRWAVDLRDAVAVYRGDNGKLHLDQSVQPTEREGAAWGGLLGGMLGALIAAPFTAGMSVQQRRPRWAPARWHWESPAQSLVPMMPSPGKRRMASRKTSSGKSAVCCSPDSRRCSCWSRPVTRKRWPSVSAATAGPCFVPPCRRRRQRSCSSSSRHGKDARLQPRRAAPLPPENWD
jgi:hypothetical protein